MAALQSMPQIEIPFAELKDWGTIWNGTVRSDRADGTPNPNPKNTECFDKKQGMDFGYVFDNAFGVAIAKMLGNIPMAEPNGNSLIPPQADFVEVGATRIVGGIHPQNFDAAYRPDGPRIIFDSKTLNDTNSIGKNWQNMVNDLATEAATVHTRFPYCIVAFIVARPAPAVTKSKGRSIIRTLGRPGSRKDELDQNHLAEAISLVLWNPNTGLIDEYIPDSDSNLRIDTMQDRI